MRITRKTLESLTQHLAKGLGLPFGHYREDKDEKTGRWEPIAGGLSLDYAACYGGYELQQIDSEGGTSVSVLSGDRKPAREMETWLRGALFVIWAHYRKASAAAESS